MITTRVQRGALGARLFTAERVKLDAEHQLEHLLDALYGRDGWAEFEYGAGHLDVYEVIPSEAGVHALGLAGFDRVTEHTHPLREFTKCACRSRAP